MTLQWVYRGIGFGGAALILLLLARNEIGRQFEPTGFLVELLLPRHAALPALLVAAVLAAAAGWWGERGPPGAALLVVAAAVAIGMLADRRIGFDWERKTFVDSYGPFGSTHDGVDAETTCVETARWSFRIVGRDRSFAVFRGIWPLRFPADALTSRLALGPCLGP